MTEFDLFATIAGEEVAARVQQARAGERVSIGRTPPAWLVEACQGDRDRAEQIIAAMRSDTPRRFRVPAGPARDTEQTYRTVLQLRATGAEPRQIAQRTGLCTRQVERIILLGRKALEVEHAARERNA